MDAPSGKLVADGGRLVGCRVGTGTRRYGHPDCAAYDVLLDGDAGPRLFWYHQLEEAS